MGYPTLFMSASAATADTPLRLSSSVSSEAYLAYKEETSRLSALRFTRMVIQDILRQIVMNNVR